MQNVSPVAVDISGIDIRADSVTFRVGEPVLMNFAAPGRGSAIQGTSRPLRRAAGQTRRRQP